MVNAYRPVGAVSMVVKGFGESNPSLGRDVYVAEEALVAAGSVLPEGKNYPSRSVIMGMPGRVVRRVGDRDLARIKESYEAYLQLSQSHLQQ